MTKTDNSDKADMKSKSNQSKTMNSKGISTKTMGPKTMGLLLSMMEWYDFAVFASLVNILGAVFFKQADSWMNLLYGFMSLSIGYFFRPLGAIIFGYIADKKNSIQSLKYSTLFMTIGTLGIGLLPISMPTLSIYILIISRMIQGAALGGCYGVSYVHVSSNTAQGKKNRAIAFVCIGFLLGFIAGNGVVGILTYLMSTENLYSFGWRIPFVFGGISSLLLFAYLIKISKSSNYTISKPENSLSNEIENNKQVKAQVSNSFTVRNTIQLVKSISLISLDMIGFHIFFIFNVSYLIQLGASQTYMSMQNVILMFAMMPTIWCFGWLSDKIGERTVLLTASILFVILGFLFPWEEQYKLVLALLTLGAVYGSLPNFVVSQFDKEHQNYFTGLSFNIASALFGGLTPIVATVLVRHSEYALSLTMGGIGIFLIMILLVSKKNKK